MTVNSIYSRWSPQRRFVIYNGDCLNLIKKIPDGSVDLVLTSPPYCIGKGYEKFRDAADFAQAHKALMGEIVRVTRTGGNICWQVGYHVKHNILTPLDFLVYESLRDYNTIKLRNRIVWTFGHGLHAEARFSGRHETLLWFSKGDEYTFNLDCVRIPQKYPGKTHYKGRAKGQPSGNPLGKNPSDVWDIPNVKANHVEKTEHPCQFPIALAVRAIRAFSDEGGLVLDPYTGVGSTAAAAALTDRRFVGAEINSKYHEIAMTRTKDALRGELRYRSDGIPVYVPKPNSPLTIRPPSWK